MTRPDALLAPPARRLWLAAAASYLFLRLLPVPGPVAWYGADLLCLPLVLGLVLAVHRLAGKPPGWRLPRSHGLALTLAYAAWFEGVAPLLLGRGTADPLDVVAYVAGWALFDRWVNR